MNIAHAIQTSTAEQEATAHLPETERHRLLANDRRRHLLDILEGVDATVRVRRLAERIGEREAAVDERVDVESVLLTLHHVHLPKLADADVVAYDPEDRTVTPLGRPDN